MDVSSLRITEKPNEKQLIQRLQTSRDRLAPVVDEIIFSAVDYIQKGDNNLLSRCSLTLEQYEEMIRASQMMKDMQHHFSVTYNIFKLPNTDLVVNTNTNRVGDHNSRTHVKDNRIIMDERTVIELLELYDKMGDLIQKMTEEATKLDLPRIVNEPPIIDVKKTPLAASIQGSRTVSNTRTTSEQATNKDSIMATKGSRSTQLESSLRVPSKLGSTGSTKEGFVSAGSITGPVSEFRSSSAIKRKKSVTLEIDESRLSTIPSEGRQSRSGMSTEGPRILDQNLNQNESRKDLFKSNNEAGTQILEPSPSRILRQKSALSPFMSSSSGEDKGTDEGAVTDPGIKKCGDCGEILIKIKCATSNTEGDDDSRYLSPSKTDSDSCYRIKLGDEPVALKVAQNCISEGATYCINTGGEDENEIKIIIKQCPECRSTVIGSSTKIDDDAVETSQEDKRNGNQPTYLAQIPTETSKSSNISKFDKKQSIDSSVKTTERSTSFDSDKKYIVYSSEEVKNKNEPQTNMTASSEMSRNVSNVSKTSLNVKKPERSRTLLNSYNDQALQKYKKIESPNDEECECSKCCAPQIVINISPSLYDDDSSPCTCEECVSRKKEKQIGEKSQVSSHTKMDVFIDADNMDKSSILVRDKGETVRDDSRRYSRRKERFIEPDEENLDASRRFSRRKESFVAPDEEIRDASRRFSRRRESFVEPERKRSVKPLTRTRICSSMEFDVTTVNTRLREQNIEHPNSRIVVELRKLGVDQLLRACRPAKCCRKAILNEKQRTGLPYCVSLKSLPLLGNDVDIIQQSIDMSVKKIKNSLDLTNNNNNRYYHKNQLAYYVTLEMDKIKPNINFPWVNPVYNARLDFGKMEKEVSSEKNKFYILRKTTSIKKFTKKESDDVFKNIKNHQINKENMKNVSDERFFILKKPETNKFEYASVKRTTVIPRKMKRRNLSQVMKHNGPSKSKNYLLKINRWKNARGTYKENFPLRKFWKKIDYRGRILCFGDEKKTILLKESTNVEDVYFDFDPEEEPSERNSTLESNIYKKYKQTSSFICHETRKQFTQYDKYSHKPSFKYTFGIGDNSCFYPYDLLDSHRVENMNSNSTSFSMNFSDSHLLKRSKYSSSDISCRSHSSANLFYGTFSNKRKSGHENKKLSPFEMNYKNRACTPTDEYVQNIMKVQTKKKLEYYVGLADGNLIWSDSFPLTFQSFKTYYSYSSDENGPNEEKSTAVSGTNNERRSSRRRVNLNTDSQSASDTDNVTPIKTPNNSLVLSQIEVVPGNQNEDQSKDFDSEEEKIRSENLKRLYKGRSRSSVNQSATQQPRNPSKIRIRSPKPNQSDTFTQKWPEEDNPRANIRRRKSIDTLSNLDLERDDYDNQGVVNVVSPAPLPPESADAPWAPHLCSSTSLPMMRTDEILKKLEKPKLEAEPPKQQPEKICSASCSKHKRKGSKCPKAKICSKTVIIDLKKEGFKSRSHCKSKCKDKEVCELYRNKTASGQGSSKNRDTLVISKVDNKIQILLNNKKICLSKTVKEKNNKSLDHGTSRSEEKR